MLRISFACLFICASLLLSCDTYHISTQSLVAQLSNSQNQRRIFVKGNDLKTITVLDKNEQEKTLNVITQTSVRIVKNDGKKNTFYFNTLIIQDSTITGSKTHFMKSNIKPISLKDVKRIEIQMH